MASTAHGVGTRLLAEKIERDEPVVFVKLGDGETSCVRGEPGANCDGDPYAPALAAGLADAVRHLAASPGVYFGAWHSSGTTAVWEHLTRTSNMRWLHYHSAMPDAEALRASHLLRFLTAIRDSKRTKILVGNALLAKAVPLLRLAAHIVVPQGGWFAAHYDRIFAAVTKGAAASTERGVLVLTCCGLGAKVLIGDLHRQFPQGVFIDIGSGLDFLCTQKDSRGAPYTYGDLERYFKSILPPGWHDAGYQSLYRDAAASFGRHLPR